MVLHIVIDEVQEHVTKEIQDYIKEQSQSTEEKKPDWVNSSYEPIKRGDLVEYHFAPGEDAYGKPTGGKKYVGLVLRTYPANVYDRASCEILENNGNTTTVETKWVRKIT